jgi:acyl-CoA thioester hydrolase
MSPRAGAAGTVYQGYPQVSIERTVEWSDTDASGHHYHGVIMRWAEAAEAALLAELGLSHLFGGIPRVRYEVDYRNRLWFGQTVRIDLRIARVGNSSLRYEFVVCSGDTVAAEGALTAARAAPDSPNSVGWPPDIRAALTGSGGAGCT